MPSSHLILYRPLPPIHPTIRVFSNESTLGMRWPKYWSFSFSIIPSLLHFSFFHICPPSSFHCASILLSTWFTNWDSLSWLKAGLVTLQQPIQTTHLVSDWQLSWHCPGCHLRTFISLTLWWVTLWNRKSNNKGTELCITWLGREGIQIGKGNKQGSSRSFFEKPKYNTSWEKKAGVNFFSNNLN